MTKLIAAVVQYSRVVFVPVYQHPFRIVQDVMLDPSSDGTVAVEDVATPMIPGRFEYQACDDRVCFPPQNGPAVVEHWRQTVGPRTRETAMSGPAERW